MGRLNIIKHNTHELWARTKYHEVWATQTSQIVSHLNITNGGESEYHMCAS